jgi:hypothetical protein
MLEKFRSVADDMLRITGIWTILIAVLSSIGGGFILEHCILENGYALAMITECHPNV